MAGALSSTTTAPGVMARRRPRTKPTTVKQDGEAVLTLESKVERGNSCRFVLRLVNNLPYEIRSLVPYYSAYRADGVIYDTVSSASSFAAMKPGDKLVRDLDFAGIACRDIVRRTGRRRRPMRYGRSGQILLEKGQCLARVRVVAKRSGAFRQMSRRPRARNMSRSASPTG